MAERKASESKKTPDSKKYPGQLVYGLDIGTRSIVGTVGYMYNKAFHVVAIESKPHETRAMQDGQIHSISAVAESITEVTSRLQIKLGRPLHEVCIAAAGRVLRTITVHVEQELGDTRDVTSEDIYSLELLGSQRAYERFIKESTFNLKFYCVGYTVQKYYLDKYPMTDLLAHKGTEIGADVIATFLPDEVVDGLYKAVEKSGLHVANLTLEPIAAMEVAIPQSFRMLNLALVDVGAGTSDISITRDESIVAYGMIPSAGDELTEAVAKHYLTDFDQAEHIKFEASKGGSFTYTDIMGIERKTSTDEVKSVVSDTVKIITRETSDQIKKLNGGKPVSAIFVVGGGGMLPGYTESLAEEMGIDPTRVAVRGEDVLKNIDFYRQSNNFIFVSFNDVQYKIYDNNKLKVLDAAVQAGFANADLFPKRGAEIAYTVNGEKRVVRGEPGEGAVIKLNGDEASLNDPIKAGDAIEVTPSTAGSPAHLMIEELPEYTDSLTVVFNGNEVSIPKYAEVNGKLQSGYYEVQDADEIIMRNYVTVSQLLSFLDVRAEKDTDILINHEPADSDTKVYENFTIELMIDDSPVEITEEQDSDTEGGEGAGEAPTEGNAAVSPVTEDEAADTPASDTGDTPEPESNSSDDDTGTVDKEDDAPESEPAPEALPADGSVINVIVNDQAVTLSGKKDYVFVDVFDHIEFDLSKPHGKMVITKKNGMRAEYSERIKDGDRLDIYWEK